jgi:proteasome lid subunit RPN8/RPN11
MNLFLKRLEFAPGIWKALMHDLWIRGSEERESGAFLLATRQQRSVVRHWISYADFDPEVQYRDYVKLETPAFGRLWDLCDQRSLEVLADVHTHPESPLQSESDRQHPMVSIPGHIALIVPNFARGDIAPVDVTFNLYRGDGRWASYRRREAAALIAAP